MTIVMLVIKDWRIWQRVNFRTTCPKLFDTFANQRTWYGFSDEKCLILPQSCLKLFCQVLLEMCTKFLHPPLCLDHAGYDHSGAIKQGAPWALQMVCTVTMLPGLLLAHASSLSARQLCSTVRIPGVSPKIILVCNIVLKKGVLAQNQYLRAHLCVQNPSGHVWCSGIETLCLHYESKGASSFMFLRVKRTFSLHRCWDIVRDSKI